MKLFNELGLSAEMLQAVTELGFTEPTPIQEKTIPMILEQKRDMIALAQTGTGKTAGFGLPVIQQISPDKSGVQALILCPTRELCLQITSDLHTFSKFSNKVSIVAVYGGASIEIQTRALKRGAQIVVGTPGRTLDMLKRKVLAVRDIRWLILDEADEMLNMGFREDLDAILESTPEEKQTLLFSATMPDGVRHITANYMNDPVEISSGKINTGADNVLHHYYIVKPHDRYNALKRLADLHPDIYGLVFCRTRAETKDLADKLIADGYNADALHGDLSQPQRDIVMNRFRTKQLQLLVATDVAARGIDINNLTHVINYSLPDDPEVYIHRSGRTGRAGKTGISIIIASSREMSKIREVEKITGKKFQPKTIPSGKEICEKQLYSLIDKIESIKVDEEQIQPYMEVIKTRMEWLDRDELLKRFVSVEFNHFLQYYKDSGDINVKAENELPSSGRRNQSRQQFSRMFINVGSKQHIKAPNLIGLINEHTRMRDIQIGRIDISHNFSFFEVEKEHENTVLNAFKDQNFGSVKLIVETSKSTDRRDERGGGSSRSSSGGRSGGYDRNSGGGRSYDRGSSRSGGYDRSSSSGSRSDRGSDRPDRTERSNDRNDRSSSSDRSGRRTFDRNSKPGGNGRVSRSFDKR